MDLNLILFEKLLRKIVLPQYQQIKEIESIVDFSWMGKKQYDVHFLLKDKLECEDQMRVDVLVKNIFGQMASNKNDKVRSFFKYRNGKYEFACKYGYIH